MISKQRRAIATRRGSSCRSVSVGWGVSYGFAWWVVGRLTPASEVRMAGRRAAAGSAGPALWALLVLVAILLPTVLAAPMDDSPPAQYSGGNSTADTIART